MRFSLPQGTMYAAALICLAGCCSGTAAALAGNADRNGKESQAPPRIRAVETVVIPGPLRSFLRMAAISQEVSPDDVVPLLARSVSLYGYESGRQTEYLVLLNRYVHIAREMRQLADQDGMIRVAGCEDAGRLIQILGYKTQGVCGHRGFSLMTADAERAFLTIDSGFPLTALERALQKSEPFNYSFPASRVPIFFTEKEWIGLSVPRRARNSVDLIDAILQDQNLDRLYWALAECDGETRNALKQSVGLRKLMSLAPAFELYGSGLRIHDGRVRVPAGSEEDWKNLAGESPRSVGDFVPELFTRDHGWLGAYFDAVSHLNQTQQAHLAQNDRLTRLYVAYRSGAPHTAATIGVFPRDADLLVLLDTVKWRENGEPEIPGDLAMWKDIYSKKKREDHDWAKLGSCCESAERLVEELVADSHLESDSSPVEIYLTLSSLDSGRSGGRLLSDSTKVLIASKHAEFNRWFSIFGEFPALDDASVIQFLSAADHINSISNPTLRANALGSFQAEIGLWQIFARQGEIPTDRLNATWLSTVQPFAGVSSSLQLFDAARSSLQAMLQAAAGKSNLSQDEIIDLLAGPTQNSQDARRVHIELAQRIRSVMDDQRLASIDTLFDLSDGLAAMAHGSDVKASLLPLAASLREFEMPRPIFTGNERATWSPLVYTRRHAELQVRTDLAKVIQSPASPAQLEGARSQLAPFLRDTLVGLNYAYYEPPGAEVLHSNPLFVRSHDFSSISILGAERIWGESSLIGVGATAGGGAYLMGSLADLPYALASTEGELIAPKNVQALIWQEAVPDLLVDGVLPRWWNIGRDELHAADLYQRAGDELFVAAAKDAVLREKVLGILSDRMTPIRLEDVEDLSQRADDVAVSSHLLPSEAFYLSAEFEKKFPGEAAHWSAAAKELDALAQKDPTDANPERLARDFGVPHTTLLATNACGLLNMKTPPAFAGHASRLFAQSWESDNLYWARLADEMGYSPVMLNLLVPALTRRMVVNIFASNVDDWPALDRAMRETGDEFRNGKISVAGITTIASNQ